jgi:hypothetical protein
MIAAVKKSEPQDGAAAEVESESSLGKAAAYMSELFRAPAAS